MGTDSEAQFVFNIPIRGNRRVSECRSAKRPTDALSICVYLRSSVVLLPESGWGRNESWENHGWTRIQRTNSSFKIPIGGNCWVNENSPAKLAADALSIRGSNA